MPSGGPRPNSGRPKGSKGKAHHLFKTKEEQEIYTRAALAKRCRQEAVRAFNTLIEIMENPKATYASRVSAAQAILDRGLGKAGSFEEMERLDKTAQELVAGVSKGGLQIFVNRPIEEQAKDGD